MITIIPSINLSLHFLKKCRTVPFLLAGALLFCLMFLPQKTIAVFGVGEDIASTNSQNALPFLLPIFTYFFGIITQLLFGGVTLMISTFILQTAVNNSAAWIDINSPFVQTGLTVTTAVADIFLIIAFISIAIGYVFKVEGYGNQKMIVKFFAAALLVHFAPLFVGMINDISNILLKGILKGNEIIFFEVLFHQMLPSVGFSILTMGASLGGLLAFSKFYAFSTFANVGAGGIFLTTMGTQMPKFLAQIITLTIINGIVTAHAFLFLTRVFMMQLLAVISPLAILSYAIPSAKKLFDLWKDWLLGWAFGGLLLLFLLVLGLTSLPTFDLPNADVEAGALSGLISFNMEWSFKWIALAVYMMAADAFCLIAIPALAGEFQKKMESAGSGFKPGGSKAVKDKIFGTKKTEGWLNKKPPASGGSTASTTSTITRNDFGSFNMPDM